MKLPEPYRKLRNYVANVGYVGPDMNLYTEAQLKQAVRDALEAAARIDLYESMRNNFDSGTSEHIARVVATKIRKLMEGL